MKKRLKMFGVMLLTGSIVLGSSQFALAGTQTKQKYEKMESGYVVHTMTVTTGPSNELKKLSCYGVEKKNYTSGSITVTTNKTATFKASSKIKGDVAATMRFLEASFSASYKVEALKKVSVSAGTTININAKAPKGIYYACVGTQRRKVRIKRQTCTLNHTGWFTWFDKEISYAPVKGSEYLTVKTLDQIK